MYENEMIFNFISDWQARFLRAPRRPGRGVAVPDGAVHVGGRGSDEEGGGGGGRRHRVPAERRLREGRHRDHRRLRLHRKVRAEFLINRDIIFVLSKS